MPHFKNLIHKGQVEKYIGIPQVFYASGRTAIAIAVNLIFVTLSSHSENKDDPKPDPRNIGVIAQRPRAIDS